MISLCEYSEVGMEQQKALQIVGYFEDEKTYTVWEKGPFSNLYEVDDSRRNHSIAVFIGCPNLGCGYSDPLSQDLE